MNRVFTEIPESPGILEATQAQVRGSFCIEEIPKPAAIVIYGASGDLTARKLIPSLFNLYRRDLLPDRFHIIGCARSSYTDRSFREHLAGSLKQLADEKETLNSFLARCTYISGEYDSPELYQEVTARLEQIQPELGSDFSHIHYLATPPGVYQIIVEHLGKAGLTNLPGHDGERVRVVVEKPFGRDLSSAMALDNALRTVLSEQQIYRIDHYLGKETVQNILLFRFANSIFEPIWNRRYIDHIQITVAESLGVGHRAGYFEQAGLLRDMFQNHMLQMLSLATMEPPISFDADRVRDEKVKLLRSIRPFLYEDPDTRFVRGQYGPGSVDDSPVPGYREEQRVDPESGIETFVAAKVCVDNWRWQGVPIYLRAGKRLNRKASRIAVRFKSVPHSMFTPLRPSDLSSNVLMFNVQPEEGILLKAQMKRPGPKLCMDTLHMHFHYQDVIKGELPDAYERLLLDCMLGDQTLFIRHDDMEISWSLFTPLLRGWEQETSEELYPLHRYESGSWGPEAADHLIRKDGRAWINT
jgi:glucose-6-phosphate 1-dehydrogenase